MHTRPLPLVQNFACVIIGLIATFQSFLGQFLIAPFSAFIMFLFDLSCWCIWKSDLSKTYLHHRPFWVFTLSHAIQTNRKQQQQATSMLTCVFPINNHTISVSNFTSWFSKSTQYLLHRRRLCRLIELHATWNSFSIDWRTSNCHMPFRDPTHETKLIAHEF